MKYDLHRSQSPDEAMRFAKKYAKNKENFNFQYLRERNGDYYEVTIRKYYTENEWDDWDAVKAANPRKSKNNQLVRQIAKEQEKPSLETQLSAGKLFSEKGKNPERCEVTKHYENQK